MQQLIELPSRHSAHRFDVVDQSFPDHLARDPDGCRGGALAAPRL